MSERQKNAIVYRKLQYSNAYHNHCYKLKEILSIVTEITIKFSRYLNKKSKLSWEKKKQKKTMERLQAFVCHVILSKMTPGSLCLFCPPFLFPYCAETGVGRSLLTSVGLLVEQYTDEHKERCNIPNK